MSFRKEYPEATYNRQDKDNIWLILESAQQDSSIANVDRIRLCDIYDKLGALPPIEADAVARWLYNNFQVFSDALKRNALARKNYFDVKRDGVLNCKDISRNPTASDVRQHEKAIEKIIFNSWGVSNSPHQQFGTILSYEIPSVPHRADMAIDPSRGAENEPFNIRTYCKTNQYSRGPIDLISVKSNTLYILELKKEESQENIHRCFIEAYTYFRTIKRIDEFIEDIKAAFGKAVPDVNSITRICIAPLLFRNRLCRPYSQWNSLEQTKHLRKLLDEKISTILVSGLEFGYDCFHFSPHEEQHIRESLSHSLHK